jgi:hypothetical protein
MVGPSMRNTEALWCSVFHHSTENLMIGRSTAPTSVRILVTISAEFEAQILRYYHVEKWRVGTIASQLGIHHGVVARVLAQAACRRQRRRRPRRKAEAYLRLRTLPGEQAQIDWAQFGHLAIGKARRPLTGFVIVLAYSRRIFLRFFLDARMESFLSGHVEAFHAWQRGPRVCLYDNLKSAVLERRGDIIRFHPTLLDLARCYGFEPRAAAVARGNEKGRVERAIRYVRDSFFAARPFDGLDDLNRQAEARCDGLAADRRCPEDTTRTVRDVFAEEAPLLLPLPDNPDNPFPILERVEVRIGKTPYARFDKNDYSVPHACVQRTLTVLAEPHELRILGGQRVVARHRRTWGKGEQIETPEHIAALAAEKAAARRHRNLDRLAQTAPDAQALLAAAAERGFPITRFIAELVLFLDQYGPAELQAAIRDAIDRDAPHLMPSASLWSAGARRDDSRPPSTSFSALPEKSKRIS